MSILVAPDLPTRGTARLPKGVKDPCLAARTCLRGYHLTTVYQPADRCWTFQWAETAIFVGLGLALLGLSYWWLRRRLT